MRNPVGKENKKRKYVDINASFVYFENLALFVLASTTAQSADLRFQRPHDLWCSHMEVSSSALSLSKKWSYIRIIHLDIYSDVQCLSVSANYRRCTCIRCIPDISLSYFDFAPNQQLFTKQIRRRTLCNGSRDLRTGVRRWLRCHIYRVVLEAKLL